MTNGIIFNCDEANEIIILNAVYTRKNNLKLKSIKPNNIFVNGKII